MKKQIFISVLALLCLAFYAGDKAYAAKPKKNICIQLYDVRDLIGGDKYQANHVKVLKQIADMGYTSIEAAGYDNGKLYGETPEQFKKDIEDAGMKVLSSHCSKALSADELASGNFSESLNWWKQCIAAHKAAGMKYIVDPWIGSQKSLKDLDTYCKYLNEIGKLCKESGIQFGYHNHSYEFDKTEDKVMYDYMLTHTDPNYVFFEMDLYWAMMGHASPVDYFDQYPGRFKMFHVKDRKYVGQSGMVGFDAIFNSAAKAGLKDFVVEIEETNEKLVPEYLQKSIDYLLNAPFVKADYSK